jgi:hypothetical protein
MALVRKTTKLQELIVKQLDEAREKKATALLTSANITKKITTFIQAAFDEGLIVPNADKEWAMGHSRATVGNYLGYQALECHCHVQWPAATHYFMELIDLELDIDFIFPVFHTPCFLFRNPEKTVSIGLATREDYCDIYAEPSCNLVFTIPKLVSQTVREDKTIPYEYVYKPKEMEDEGHYKFNMSKQQLNKINPVVLDLENESDNYSGKLHDLFQEFVDIHISLIDSLARIDKSQQYIFNELWKLPSLNKMREFFPAITAFIPEETLNKLNQGASARKKEYNISMPDSDVIVSATEASIKT